VDVGPVAPTGPVAPVDPVAPVAPVAPVGPAIAGLVEVQTVPFHCHVLAPLVNVSFTDGELGKFNAIFILKCLQTNSMILQP